MAYSSIVRKKCKCGCKRYPALGYSGYSFSCAPEEIKLMVGSKMDVQRKNANARKAISVKLRAEIRKEDITNDLELFFRICRLKMTGNCIEGDCTNSTSPKNDNYYRWSIAHIVPKSLVKSVATNENNWIELCQLHHQEFDATFERASKMKCFAEAKSKFQLFKHLIPDSELRKVNPFLFQT